MRGVAGQEQEEEDMQLSSEWYLPPPRVDGRVEIMESCGFNWDKIVL